MKKLYPFFFLVMLSSACTETLYEEVEKYIKEDSLIYKIDTVFIDRLFSHTDTVELHTVTL